nr:hypothetical protein [Thermoanaerobaculia bacterium]
EPWNELLAREGAEIARERAAYTGKLSEAFEELLAELALPLPVIELAYLPSPSDALGGEAAILGALERAGREELRRGRPLVGPHRDDLEIRFRGTEVRRAASAGERKALSLLLSAAHGLTLERAGRLPIYLLDDLDAELSREMLASIWRPLSRGRQVLTTSNRPEVWQELEVDQRFELDEGRVRAA